MPLSAKSIREQKLTCETCRYCDKIDMVCVFYPERKRVITTIPCVEYGESQTTINSACAHWDKDLPGVENQALMDKLTGKGE